MDKVIEEIIDTVNNHRTPSGYCRTKDIGLAPIDWTLGKMSDVITHIKRAVPKPDKPYWRLGIKSWARGTFHAYVDEPETVDMDELYEVHENDLVVNITFAWEHAIAIANKDDQGLLVSHRFPTYEFKDGQVPNFYKSVISQQFFKDMLEHISPGGAGRNRVLNQKDFLNLPCYIPPLSEQKKISEILDHYDKLINLCEAKVNEYKSLKKTCLRKMFPQNGSNVPELRFPGFTGAWEQRKLGELSEKTYGGGTPSTSNPDYWRGNIAWLQSSDIPDGKLFDVVPKKFISPEGLNNSAAQLVPENSIAIITRVGVGKLAFLPFSYTTSQDFLSMSKLKTEPFFTVYACYEKLQSELNAVQGTSIKGITKDELLAKEIMVPKYDEQKQIGGFFKRIDNLITLHQREVKEYTKLKKVMTQLLLTGIVRVK